MDTEPFYMIPFGAMLSKKIPTIRLSNSWPRMLIWTATFLLFSAVLSTEEISEADPDFGNGLENSRFVKDSSMSWY